MGNLGVPFDYIFVRSLELIFAMRLFWGVYVFWFCWSYNASSCKWSYGEMLSGKTNVGVLYQPLPTAIPAHNLSSEFFWPGAACVHIKDPPHIRLLGNGMKLWTFFSIN